MPYIDGGFPRVIYRSLAGTSYSGEIQDMELVRMVGVCQKIANCRSSSSTFGPRSGNLRVLFCWCAIVKFEAAVMSRYSLLNRPAKTGR